MYRPKSFVNAVQICHGLNSVQYILVDKISYMSLYGEFLNQRYIWFEYVLNYLRNSLLNLKINLYIIAINATVYARIQIWTNRLKQIFN